MTATHAPGCDVPMGWGVAEAGALIDRGVAVGLGTSGGGSNDAGHLLADARLAMQVSALTGRVLTAREVLTMATAGSAAGLGRPELGHLEVGRRRRPRLLRHHRPVRRRRGRPPRRPGVGQPRAAGRATSWWAAGSWCATALLVGADGGEVAASLRHELRRRGVAP